MAKVTFTLPNGKGTQVIEARPDESVLDVALRSGIKMQNDCGASISCGTCQILIKTGPQNLSSQGLLERSVLRSQKNVKDHSRLACQSKVVGDVSVEIVNELD